MSVAELIAELEAVGVRLWEESGKVHFRSPKGIMTAERQAALRSQKQEILAYLQGSTTPAAIKHDVEGRYEPFPLTDVQGAYLLGRRQTFAYGGVACHAYGELAILQLDPVRLQAAWQMLINRHDMLRAIVDEDGSQRVLPQVPTYAVVVNDLRGASANALRATIDATRAELSHKMHPPGQWPLFALQITLADAECLLHLSIDFLIADYISIHVLLDELASLYADPEKTLPPLSITFRDYQLAQRQWRTDSRYERDREYWWKRIDSLPSAPELPVFERTTPDATVRFRNWKTRLGAEDWLALQRSAGENDLTPSGAILAAYAEVITRWSRSPRLTLDITLLQRLPLHSEVDRLVGDFTSVSLLSVKSDYSHSFSARAKALQDQLWQDLDHRLCSGIEVIREIARRRGSAGALMPVVFTSAIGLNSKGTKNATDPLGNIVYSISQTPQVWIDCQAMERQNCLEISWDVREGVFPEGLSDDMFGAFEDLIRSLSRDRGVWESKIPITLPQKQLEVRRLTNATSGPLPQGLLHESVVSQALRTPERPAVIAEHGLISYGDLLTRARTVAGKLREAGVGPGAIVAVLMDKGVEQVIGVLGTLLAGAAYLPIDTSSPAARRNQILENAGVQTVLSQSWLDAGVPASVRLTAVDKLQPGVMPDHFPLSQTQPYDLAYVIYTSGSTGIPKGVMISHRSALNTVSDINRRLDVRAEDRVLSVAQLGFDLSVYDIFGPLAVGGALVLPNSGLRHDPGHWARLIADHDVTLWNSVPAQMQMLLEYLASEPVIRLPSLRQAMLSGDWIPVALPAQIRNRLPDMEILSLGGATEAAIWSVIYPIGEVGGNWRSIPYGKPLTNQTCHLFDVAMLPCPDWKAGQLYIGGIGVADGYLGDTAKTSQCFIRHPESGERLYRTGDWARYLPDGNLEFIGRDDLQVKIRGHRIELAEIEVALQLHPAVGNAAVVAYGNVPSDRCLAGFVEPASTSATDAVWRNLREEVAATAEEFGTKIRAGVDPAPIVEFAAHLDHTALLGMVYALRQQGLFSHPEDNHSLDDILAVARVAPRHHRLIRRWLNALVSNHMVDRDPVTGRYHHAIVSDRERVEDAWHKVEEMRPEVDRRAELLDYFRLAGQHLSELLRGELDPIQLLFPRGRVEINEVAYSDNFLSRYLNRLVSSTVSELARRHSGSEPFQVLEVGAGVGGTSIELIPTLATFPVEYLFTDVSQFFLNNAKDRFGQYVWVNYALFDMNKDYRSQGLLPNHFDAVVCGNVLHYAHDANVVLGRIRELLKPGGWLVFIDMVRDNYQVLTSMEFLFDATVSDFEDLRRGLDATFINLEQWHSLIEAAGARMAMCLPRANDPFSKIGFHVFAAQFKTDREPVSSAELTAHLTARLPKYMVPPHIEVVDALPLTTNGKVDRAALQSWLSVKRTDEGANHEKPASDLEQRLATIWAKLIGVPSVGRNQSFFEVGGDSLLAAQLVGRIRDELPEATNLFFDNLLRLVLEDPTVAQLAGELANLHTPADTPKIRPASPLICLGGANNRETRVLVHDASGTLASYSSLLTVLAEGYSLTGLVVNDPESYLQTLPRLLLERIAGQYAALLKLQRGTAFHFLGCDFGGILALETASRLLEAGCRVESLTVVGGLPGNWLIEDELLLEYFFVRGAGVDPVRLGFPVAAALATALNVVLQESPKRVPDGRLVKLTGESQLSGVAWSFRRLATTTRGDRLARFGRALASPGSEPAAPSQVAQLYNIFCHSTKALAEYEVRPYAGDVTLLIPLDEPLLSPSARTQLTDFWQRICLGELRVVEVAGDVCSCLRPPQVSHLAELLLGAA